MLHTSLINPQWQLVLFTMTNLELLYSKVLFQTQGWPPDIFRPKYICPDTLSSQNWDILRTVLIGGRDFQQNCVQDGAGDLSPCKEFSVSYALKETVTRVGGE